MSREAKERFDDGDVAKALDTEVEAAIKEVWLPAFIFFEKCLNLLTKFALTSLVAVDVGGWAGVLLMAAVVVACRHKHQLSLQSNCFETSENWSSFATLADKCRSLITGYSQDW